MRLTVCHPKLTERLSGYEGSWLYADTDAQEFSRIPSRFAPGAKHLLTPAELQRLVADSRQDFVEWIDENLTGKDIVPAILNALSRDPFHPLFYEAVMMCAVARHCSSEAGELVVVTQSPSLRLALLRSAFAEGMETVCHGTFSYWLAGLWRFVRPAAIFASDATNAFVRAWLARRLLGRPHLTRAKGVDVLVDTYLLRGDVLVDGTVKHRYFPGLVDWYQARGHRVAYLPLLYRYPMRLLPALYRGYKASKYVFVPLELVCGYWDIGRAMLACIRQALVADPLARRSLWNVPMTELVRYQKPYMALVGLTALLRFFGARRMNQVEIQPRFLIDWQENQPVDQATAAGFIRFQPGCQVIGVRQYALFGDNVLSQQVTDREVKAGLAPTRNWMCGELWLPYAKRYDSIGEYRLVPGLRYAHLLNRRSSKEEGDGLLVLLTHSESESAHILSMVGASLPYLSEAFSRILIKPQPILDVNRMRRRFFQGRYPELFSSPHIEWIAGSLQDAAAPARVAMTAGTSAALEVVCMGVPTIIVGMPTGIDMNPLELADAKLWQLVYSSDEFERAIRSWTPSHPLPQDERIARGKLMMKQAFGLEEPLNWEAFSLGDHQSV